MIRFKCGSLLCLVALTGFYTSAVAQEKTQLLSREDSRILKSEFRQRNSEAALARIKSLSKREGKDSESMALLKTFMKLQSSRDWVGSRDILNPLMRTELQKNVNNFRGHLKESEREKSAELALMGKLYEKHLEDKDEARNCYIKVVGRFLEDGVPQTADQWEDAVWRAESFKDLNAHERHAFKRLLNLERQKEIVANRILAAIDQKIYEEELAAAVSPESSVDPNRFTVPEKEIKRTLEKIGGRQ